MFQLFHPVVSSIQTNPLLTPGAPGGRRLGQAVRRMGRTAVELVLFLGFGGAMVAGALLLR